jgi:hypothetical protein
MARESGLLSVASVYPVAGLMAAPALERRVTLGPEVLASQTLPAAAATLYYADDAVAMPPNAPAITTKDALQKAWAAMLAPGNSLTWTPSTVTAAGSGDIAAAPVAAKKKKG